MEVSNILSLLGGVALFLFGMSVMGDSLKKVAGSKMELVLYRLSGKRDQGYPAGHGSNSRYTVVIRNVSYGSRLRKLRHHEGQTGHRNHPGRHPGNQYHGLDPTV